jgi:hypothetical protein
MHGVLTPSCGHITNAVVALTLQMKTLSPAPPTDAKLAVFCDEASWKSQVAALRHPEAESSLYFANLPTNAAFFHAPAMKPVFVVVDQAVKQSMAELVLHTDDEAQVMILVKRWNEEEIANDNANQLNQSVIQALLRAKVVRSHLRSGMLRSARSAAH